MKFAVLLFYVWNYVGNTIAPRVAQYRQYVVVKTSGDRTDAVEELGAKYSVCNETPRAPLPPLVDEQSP